MELDMTVPWRWSVHLGLSGQHRPGYPAGNLRVPPMDPRYPNNLIGIPARPSAFSARSKSPISL